MYRRLTEANPRPRTHPRLVAGHPLEPADRHRSPGRSGTSQSRSLAAWYARRSITLAHKPDVVSVLAMKHPQSRSEQTHRRTARLLDRPSRFQACGSLLDSHNSCRAVAPGQVLVHQVRVKTVGVAAGGTGFADHHADADGGDGSSGRGERGHTAGDDNAEQVWLWRYSSVRPWIGSSGGRLWGFRQGLGLGGPTRGRHRQPGRSQMSPSSSVGEPAGGAAAS